MGRAPVRLRARPLAFQTPWFWALFTSLFGGMPHVQLRHQEPGASEQCAGHAAGCCKPRRVWACGTRGGPNNVSPAPSTCGVHLLRPAKTWANKPKQSWISAMGQKVGLSLGFPMRRDTLSSMAGSSSQSIAIFVTCRARTNAKRKFAFRRCGRTDPVNDQRR